MLGVQCGCTILVPDASESTGGPATAPSGMPQMPAGCPAGDGVSVPESLGNLSGEDGAAVLLSRLSDWANAGTEMITNEPDWVTSTNAQQCLAALASGIGQMYGQVLFHAAGDDSLDGFRDALVAENLVNLSRSRAQGQASHAEFWMQNLLGATSSGTGWFLKMNVRVQPGDSTRPRRLEQWFVIFEPQHGANALTHVDGFAPAGAGE